MKIQTKSLFVFKFIYLFTSEKRLLNSSEKFPSTELNEKPSEVLRIHQLEPTNGFLAQFSIHVCLIIKELKIEVSKIQLLNL